MVGRVYAAAIGRCSRDVHFGACAHRPRMLAALDRCRARHAPVAPQAHGRI